MNAPSKPLALHLVSDHDQSTFLPHLQASADFHGSDCSVVLATLVILPRLPSRNGAGSVFWGDIAGCGGPTEYRDRFGATASAGLLDEEYSILNFHTARILEKKIRILRVAILSFLAGILTALPHYLTNA